MSLSEKEELGNLDILWITLDNQFLPNNYASMLLSRCHARQLQIGEISFSKRLSYVGNIYNQHWQRNLRRKPFSHQPQQQQQVRLQPEPSTSPQHLRLYMTSEGPHVVIHHQPVLWPVDVPVVMAEGTI